jgi:hypothetical protein
MSIGASQQVRAERPRARAASRETGRAKTEAPTPEPRVLGYYVLFSRAGMAVCTSQAQTRGVDGDARERATRKAFPRGSGSTCTCLLFPVPVCFQATKLRAPGVETRIACNHDIRHYTDESRTPQKNVRLNPGSGCARD